MKKQSGFCAALAIASLVWFQGVGAAAGKPYIGLQFGSADTGIDGESENVDLEYGMLQLGIWTDDAIALEVRGGTGTNEDSIRSAEFEIESLYGVYGLYHIHLGEFASVYGAAGWSETSLKTSSGNDSSQEYEDGFSYGIGVKIAMFSLEYMRYLDTDDIEADAIAVGLHYSFD